MSDKVVFSNIEEIQKWWFQGNHFSDHQAFNGIQVFVENENNSLADRAEALRVMSDKGMGCGRDEDITDEEYVAGYLQEL